MEVVGWIGSMLLAICGLPQAYKSFKDKNSRGISWGFLILWGSGELITLIYITPMNSLPLIVNYSLNSIFIAVIIYYKHNDGRGE